MSTIDIKPRRRSFTNSVTFSISKVVQFFNLQSNNPSASAASSPPKGLTSSSSINFPSRDSWRYNSKYNSTDGRIHRTSIIAESDVFQRDGSTRIPKSKTTDNIQRYNSLNPILLQQNRKSKSFDSAKASGKDNNKSKKSSERHTIQDVLDLRAQQARYDEHREERERNLKRAKSEPFLNSWDFSNTPISTPVLQSRKTERAKLRRVASVRFDSGFVDEDENTDMINSKTDPGPDRLLFQEGSNLVKAGSILDIFNWLMYRLEDEQNDILNHSYLLSFPKFCSALDILQELMKIYESAASRQKLKASLFLKAWIEHYFYRDFGHGDGIVEILVQFISNYVSPLFPQMAKILTNLIAVQKIGEQLSPELFQVKNEFTDFSPSEFAKQMTLFDFDIFLDIKPWEFMESAENNKVKTGRNMERFTKRFNAVSMWAALEIVSAINSKRRVEIVKRMISIAKKLEQLQNFNSLMAILSALNMAPVRRLKSTWKKIPTKTFKVFQDLEEMMAPYNNFWNYRSLLQNSEPPIIPLSVVHQRDIVFIIEGNPATFPTTRSETQFVNFERTVMIANTIDEMVRCQKKRYNFAENEIIQNFLNQLMVVDEKELHKFSLKCESSSKEQ